MKNHPKIPLAEQLKNLGWSEPRFFPFYTLYLKDYFTALNEYLGINYYDTVYGSDFHRHDPDATLLLAEMVDKAANFAPERRGKLLYELLIEPFILIHLQEQKE